MNYDDRIWTHECCRELRPPTDDDRKFYEENHFDLPELVPGEAHAPHETREDAEACFHEWRRRQGEDWQTGEWSNWQGCEICDAPTKQSARFRDIGRPTYITLCDEHRTTENVLAYIDEHRVTASTYS